MEKRIRRAFTPEQKFAMLKDIAGKLPALSCCVSVSEVEAAIGGGGRASLRNSTPFKASNLRRLEAENRTLKVVVLTQSLIISELKEMNWDGQRRDD